MTNPQRTIAATLSLLASADHNDPALLQEALAMRAAQIDDLPYTPARRRIAAQLRHAAYAQIDTAARRRAMRFLSAELVRDADEADARAAGFVAEVPMVAVKRRAPWIDAVRVGAMLVMGGGV